jgi:superfamily II DNA helicase RecQ
VEAGIALILVSPEMLSTSGFRSLIASKDFQSRLFAIGVDEVHLLSSWGLEFRPAYQQIGYVRKRFRDDVVMFGLSATLRNGKQFETVCKFLGFQEGRFKFVRCSNARPDIHLIFRTLRTTLASEDFPDLAWILTEPGQCPRTEP